MKSYMAISETSGNQFGDEVDAENVREACDKMGFTNFTVEGDDVAVAWLGNEAFSISTDD